MTKKKLVRNAKQLTLTFQRVAVEKAEQIMEERGETFSGLCARLINDEYDRIFEARPSKLSSSKGSRLSGPAEKN